MLGFESTMFVWSYSDGLTTTGHGSSLFLRTCILLEVTMWKASLGSPSSFQTTQIQYPRYRSSQPEIFRRLQVGGSRHEGSKAAGDETWLGVPTAKVNSERTNSDMVWPGASPADTFFQRRGKFLRYKTFFAPFFHTAGIVFHLLARFFWANSTSTSTMASSRLCTPLTRALARNSISRPAHIASRLPRARTVRFYSSKKESKDQFIIWRPWLRLSIGIPFIGALIYSMVWHLHDWS